MVERIGLYRLEIWISILMLVVPWLIYGFDYPIQLIHELDHCSVLACDFVRHYLPQAESARSGLPEMNNGWFYPPLLAMLLIPFTYFKAASLLWTVVNLCGVIVLIRLIRTRDSLVPILLTAALCATSLPILHTIKWGQVSIWLAVFLCVPLFPNGVLISDRSLPSEDRDTQRFTKNWTAWLIGLAAAIKVYPIVFVLIPLLGRRLSWALHCVLALVIVGVLLPWLWMGSDVLQYFYAIQRGQQTVSDMGTIAGGQALGPALHRWFVSGEFIGVSASGPWSTSALLFNASWLKPTMMLGAVVFLLKTIWTVRTTKVDTATIFTLLITIHLLLQPGWVHYFCWLPLVHVWCWYKARGKSKVFWVLGLAILLERIPLLFLERSNYFASSRAGWMTVVLLLTLMVLSFLSDSTEDANITKPIDTVLP